MQKELVNLRRLEPVLQEQAVDLSDDTVTDKVQHLQAVHLDLVVVVRCRRLRRRLSAGAGLDVKAVPAAAVAGEQKVAELADQRRLVGLTGCADPGCCGAITEKHAGGPVAGRDVLGVGVGSDHQHIAGRTGGNKARRHQQPVDKAGAGQVVVKREQPGLELEIALQQKGVGGHHQVGRLGAKNDGIHLGRQARMAVEQLPGGRQGQVVGGLVRSGDPALKDAGALLGLRHVPARELGRQLGIAQHLLGQGVGDVDQAARKVARCAGGAQGLRHAAGSAAMKARSSWLWAWTSATVALSP